MGIIPEVTRPRLLIERARALAPFLTGQAAANEAAGRLGDDTLQTLRQDGFFNVMVPKCCGGLEATACESIEVIEALSYGDGSTGWVTMATNVLVGMAASYLPDAGVKRIYANGLPFIAGQGAPNGKAVAEPGGWRLTGRWGYGSGTLHADFIHTGALLYDGDKLRMSADGKTPETLTFIVPREQVELEDNWDVIGLKATGSVDYAIKDQFIPAELAHPHESTSPLRGGGFYTVGILGMTALGHTAFALGVARRALDDVAQYARDRPPRRGALPALSESESYHVGYGAAEAQYRSARAFVYDVWGDVDETCRRGDKMSTRQVTLVRLALNHVTTAASEVCGWAYRTGGGYALRSSVLQRCFRDMEAGAQHFLTSTHVLKECGRELAGLAEGQRWTLLGLRDSAA